VLGVIINIYIARPRRAVLQPEAPFDLPDVIFSYPEVDESTEQQHMTIHLTPEQERRIRAVLDRGAYKSVEEVVEAALTAVEQRTVPGFAGRPEEPGFFRAARTLLSRYSSR